MNLPRWLRWARRALSWCGRALAWTLGTTWLGGVALIRLGSLLGHLPDLFAEELPCPRGHPVALYGVYDCTCGSVHEGWAFGRCAVCGQSAGWTPCPECSLPVRSPLRS